MPLMLGRKLHTESINMTTPIQRALAFLRADLLRNIVLLKTLGLFPDAVQCHYCEDGGGAGVLILLPTAVSSFDRHTYPTTHYVVLLSATSQAAVRQLLAFVPRDTPLVFKLIDDADRQTIEQVVSLRRTTAFISYTAPLGSHFRPSGDVRVTEQIDPACYALYAEQGHSPQDLAQYAAAGTLGFAVYRDAAPIASCFAYRNYDTVHEIAGVYTLPSHRRHGHARQIVETALHTLARRQFIPRYQVHEGNHASIQLAESIGLRRFVTMEHWLTTPVAPC
jgi:GNAT superfamily N-acetyltransferase